MHLLDKSEYYKVMLPLQSVTIDNLFAFSVVEQSVNGSIYVDEIERPTTIYIVHPYGMSLLFGNTTNESFNSMFFNHALNNFKVRNTHEWLQVFPTVWEEKMVTLFKEHLINSIDNTSNATSKSIEVNTRVNFAFKKEKYKAFKSNYSSSINEVVRTDKKQFNELQQGVVVPKDFWIDADQFCATGVGYSLIYKEAVASTAFSAYLNDRQLEIGIETNEKYRGNGFALHVCVALIDYCLEHDYEPVWTCRLENNASYKLAQKLSFEPVRYLPYYRLCK